MKPQRTGAMTAFGVCNMVFGGLGSLFAIFVVLLGGVFAAGGAKMAGHSGQAAGAATAAGGMVMLVGLCVLLFWAALAASGYGIFKVAPWGRTLAMGCAVAGAAFTLFSIVTSGFAIDLGKLLVMAYCGTLMYMCMRPDWKSAFCCKTGQTNMPTTSYGSDKNYRAAA